MLNPANNFKRGGEMQIRIQYSILMALALTSVVAMQSYAEDDGGETNKGDIHKELKGDNKKISEDRMENKEIRNELSEENAKIRQLKDKLKDDIKSGASKETLEADRDAIKAANQARKQKKDELHQARKEMHQDQKDRHEDRDELREKRREKQEARRERHEEQREKHGGGGHGKDD